MNGLARVVVVFASVLALQGCTGVVGNGHSVTDDRSTGAFDAIDADTSLEVHIAFGETPSVTVITDGNLLSGITTEIVGGTLRIRETIDMWPKVPSSVNIVTPTLHAADNDGSGAMSVVGFSERALHLGSHGSGHLSASIAASTLDLVADGSGGSTITGDTDAITLTQSGSGSVDASGLTARGAHVRVDGSGGASLVSTGTTELATLGSGSIHAELDDGATTLACEGSGSIHWRGNASVASESDTGSGSIVHE